MEHKKVKFEIKPLKSVAVEITPSLNPEYKTESYSFENREKAEEFMFCQLKGYLAKGYAIDITDTTSKTHKTYNCRKCNNELLTNITHMCTVAYCTNCQEECVINLAP